MSSDRLSHRIFSILESHFLFGEGSPDSASLGGRVRVLSIDGGGADDGLLAAVALARLEADLRELSGNPNARVAAFFDLIAGAGAGAFLAAVTATRRLSAAEAVEVVSKNGAALSGRRRHGLFSTRTGLFRRTFGDAKISDAATPLLMPCYDAATAAQFVFSRADAVEDDAFDFPLSAACATACGAARSAASVDGRTVVRAAGAGAVAAGANPTAVAVTHVLHNKAEFPLVAGIGDLFVLSLGAGGSPGSSAAGNVTRIAGAYSSDMVDQAMGLAFGVHRRTNYVRIQGNDIIHGAAGAPPASPTAALRERNVESVMFLGRKVADVTNAERLRWAAQELVGEQKRRERGIAIPVAVKRIPNLTPRSSSSSNSSSSLSCSSSSSASSL